MSTPAVTLDPEVAWLAPTLSALRRAIHQHPEPGAPCALQRPGYMHVCGHDGHSGDAPRRRRGAGGAARRVRRLSDAP